MSRYPARHRLAPDSLSPMQRTLTTASLGVLASAAITGTAAAWACTGGGHAQTRASVHHAVAHGHSSSADNERRRNTDLGSHDSSSFGSSSNGSSAHDSASRGGSAHDSAAGAPTAGGSAGAMRGASPSNPDGMSNGGMDKPWGAAAANDDVDGNNGSGNDLDCEDDNNGVGVPGHCGVQSGTAHHAGAHGVASVHVSDEVAGEITIVVVLHNGETTKVTVAAPAAGESVMVPVTVNGVTFTVAVTGTSTGATATVVGSTSESAGSGSASGGSGSGSAGRSAGGSGSTVVLGERFSRGLHATAPTSSSSLATSAAVGASGATTSVSPTSTALPFTGSNDGVIALIGASSVITGAGILRAARRRRVAPAATTTA